MKVFALACLLCLLSVDVFAQAPTSWTLKIYAAGSTTPLQAFAVTTQQVACNQAQPTVQTPPVQNPTQWVWDDPVMIGRACILIDTTRLLSLPDGSYEGTATAVTAEDTSAESARVPFSRLRSNPPAVPTGVRFIR